jgi:hypothetical protein
MSYTFISKFSCILSCSCLCSRLCFLARSIRVTWNDNKWSGGVLTTRVRSSVRSLHHQRRDLYQSTYLYLSEDQDLTFHQVVSKQTHHHDGHTMMTSRCTKRFHALHVDQIGKVCEATLIVALINNTHVVMMIYLLKLSL